METVRWGVLGCGRIAHSFASDMRAVNNAELVAVAARDASRSRAFAGEYGVSRAYGDYEALLQDEHIDAVYIATPHTLHAEQC